MQANITISKDILDWIIAKVDPGVLPSKLWEQLCAWKDGVKVPTYNQIEKISKASGIPLGYFFLKKPPDEDTSFVEYRTVDSVELSNPSRNLMDTMHDMEIVQDWLRNELSTTGGEKLPFVGKINSRVTCKMFADYVRQLLQLKIIAIDKVQILCIWGSSCCPATSTSAYSSVSSDSASCSLSAAVISSSSSGITYSSSASSV